MKNTMVTSTPGVTTVVGVKVSAFFPTTAFEPLEQKSAEQKNQIMSALSIIIKIVLNVKMS